MISYPCIGCSSSRWRTRPLKSALPKKWKNPPNFSGLLTTPTPSAGTGGSRGPPRRRRTRRRPATRSRGPAENIRDNPGCGRRNEPGVDLRGWEDRSDDTEDQGEQEERQDRRRDRGLERRGDEIRHADDRDHVRERVEVREPDVPREGFRHNEGRDRRGAVVQREDGGRHDQARSHLTEYEDLPTDGIREEEVAGPFLVLRNERVRGEEDAAEDDQEAGE